MDWPEEGEMVDRLAEALAVREIIFGVMMTGATVK